MTLSNLPDYLQKDIAKISDKQPAFLEHLLAKMDHHISNKGKVLLLTLTKKSSEEITTFLISK